MKKMIVTIAVAMMCVFMGVQSAYGQNAPALLNPVYKAYFQVKDALAADNGKAAQTAATTLAKQIEAVPMQKLGSKHKDWMQYYDKLKAEAATIRATADIQKQRTAFKDLSANMYGLMKKVGAGRTVYCQYCGMAKATWLSNEKAIKNPYEGAKMPTCGTIKEILK